MGYYEMNSFYENDRQGFEFQLDIEGAVEGEWIILPAGIEIFSVCLVVTAGTATVESCLDLRETVKDGTTSVALETWTAGTISAGSVGNARINKATAVRAKGLDASTVATIYIVG